MYCTSALLDKDSQLKLEVLASIEFVRDPSALRLGWYWHGLSFEFDGPFLGLSWNLTTLTSTFCYSS